MAKYITLDNLKVFLDSIATWMKEKYTKKDELKTINGQSIVGSGDITIINSETDLTNYFVDDSCYINNDGNVSFKNIEADGDLKTYGNLNVELDSILTGDLNVQGSVSCSNSLEVNGSLTVNDKNVENAIDSLQASTFTHTDTDSVDHYRLTWFTSSGGNRNVDIPTYTGKNFNSIEDAMDPNTGGSFLADGGLIEDLLDYIDQYIDSKI